MARFKYNIDRDTTVANVNGDSCQVIDEVLVIFLGGVMIAAFRDWRGITSEALNPDGE